MDSEFEELKSMYFEELTDHLDDIEALLLKIDEDHNDSESFRLFSGKVHSIKGSSGSFGFRCMAVNCHQYEDRMVALKNENMTQLVDEGFKLLDALKAFANDETEIYLYGEQKAEETIQEVDQEMAEEVKQTVTEAEPLKALVVNNSPTQTKILEVFCQKNHFKTTTTKSGFDALKFIMQEHFDLCFVATNIEILDGISLCKSMRVVESPNAKTPVCLTSTRTKLNIEGFSPDFHLSMSSQNLAQDFIKITTKIMKSSQTVSVKTAAKDLPFSRVMFIDDATNLHGLVKLAFKKTDAEVKCYPSGKAAVSDIDNFKPEVILCDMYMDDMTGVDTLHKIRETSHSQTPFIFMTAEDESSSESLSQALPLSKGIIPKPINHKKLIKSVVELLA